MLMPCLHCPTMLITPNADLAHNYSCLSVAPANVIHWSFVLMGRQPHNRTHHFPLQPINLRFTLLRGRPTCIAMLHDCKHRTVDESKLTIHWQATCSLRLAVGKIRPPHRLGRVFPAGACRTTVLQNVAQYRPFGAQLPLFIRWDLSGATWNKASSTAGLDGQTPGSAQVHFEVL